MTDVRSTQIVRETAANPTDTPVRATSVVREVVTNPSDTPVRATSIVRETATIPTDTPLRATSIVREVLFKATPTEWTNPITPDSPATAADVREVQDAIDINRERASLPPFNWTDAPIQAGTRVKAVHFQEMRTAIEPLWAHHSMGDVPPWSSATYRKGGVGPGKRIYASDMKDVRDWVNRYESVPPAPAEHGIDSLSADCSSPQRPVIQDEWAEDIRLLSPDRLLLVRTEVSGPGTPPGSSDFSQADMDLYVAAFSRYWQKGLKVFPLLTRSFYDPDGADPAAQLVGFTNDYIEGFSDRAAEISSYFRYETGLWVEDYIIWNEPDREDDPAGYLPPANFAALLCRCWQKMQTTPRIYWGGVFFGNDLQNPDVPDQRALDYISDVYQAMEDAQIPGFGYGAWPWTGINIHVHGNRTDQHFSNLFSALDGIRATWSDTGPVIVGEWGIHVGTDPNQLSNIYAKMKYHTSKMFFHSHHAIPLVAYPATPEWGLRYYERETDRFVLGIRTDADLWDAYETVVRQ